MVRSAPVKTFLEEIRIEHTLFALPFAYTGAIFGAQGWPGILPMFWITVAVFGARTAAMAANRYLDREIDARNPRTAQRAIPSGRMEPKIMLWAAAIGLLLLIAAATQLNPLCVKLLPLAALGALFYPLCKRFTWMSHFVLGAVDALAPLGAFIAVTGTVTWAAILLFFAVTVWVGGFDILYALMDLNVDREQGIHSLPARFGERAARDLPIALHGLMIIFLTVAGILGHAGWPYVFGIIAAAALLLYEDWLLPRAANVFALNEKIFTANMAFSVVFFVTTFMGFTLV